jgi:hypothetical protein
VSSGGADSYHGIRHLANRKCRIARWAGALLQVTRLVARSSHERLAQIVERPLPVSRSSWGPANGSRECTDVWHEPTGGRGSSAPAAEEPGALLVLIVGWPRGRRAGYGTGRRIAVTPVTPSGLASTAIQPKLLMAKAAPSCRGGVEAICVLRSTNTPCSYLRAIP